MYDQVEQEVNEIAGHKTHDEAYVALGEDNGTTPLLNAKPTWTFAMVCYFFAGVIMNEMGDRSQITAVAMGTNYPLWIVIVGGCVGHFLACIIGACVGRLISNLIP